MSRIAATLSNIEPAEVGQREQSREIRPSVDLRTMVRWIGLIAGPFLAGLAFLLLPSSYRDASEALVEFGNSGRATLAVMVWMAVWWLTEAVNISVTALLPLLVLPVLGAVHFIDAATPYLHPLIFLFIGGFIVALAMQRWGLDKRIALLTLRIVGTKPIYMVGGFMLTTAVLSAFISNTATTAMMLPIALSVVELVRRSGRNARTGQGVDPAAEQTSRSFATCLMLGIAYAASIGGIATIIGTPPNALLVGFLQNGISADYHMNVTFAKWLLIGLPLMAVFLPIIWLLLTRVLYPIRIGEIAGGKELIASEIQSLGPATRGELATLLVFCAMAACWMLRPLLVNVSIPLGGAAICPFSWLTDPAIAIMGAGLLFLIPVNAKRREFVMSFKTAAKLPWGILVLFGGGLSLAAAVKTNGVAEFIASHARHFAGLPPIVIVPLVVAAVIFLTELMSNIATTATLLPVLAALAPGLGVHPYLLIFPAALAASCAFMMPVATAPNAMVFGSGEVAISQMIKAGFWLNLIGVVLITALTVLFLGPVLGIKMGP